MPTRPARFQGEFNPDGTTRSFLVYDEITATDPITDAEVGTGNFLAAVPLSAETHPDLFAALDAIGPRADQRVSVLRAKHAAETRAEVTPEPLPVEPTTTQPETTP